MRRRDFLVLSAFTRKSITSSPSESLSKGSFSTSLRMPLNRPNPKRGVKTAGHMNELQIEFDYQKEDARVCEAG
jgi:hypothetical protein